jgi:hypothetical protein
MPSQNFANQYLLAVELAIKETHQPAPAVLPLKGNEISGKLMAIHRSSIAISADLLVSASVYLYTAKRKRSKDEIRLFPRRLTWLT